MPRVDDDDVLALRQAVQIGLADLAGRFTDIEPGEIDAFMARLSAEVGRRCKADGRQKG